MPVHAFDFAVDVSGHAVSEDMLRALAVRVLEHVGCAAGATGPIVEAVRAAVRKASDATSSGCRVQFTANGGTLDIDVSSSAGPIWHTSCALA